MTKYKCGHEIKEVIMNNSILGLATYLTWKDSTGFDGDESQCWECFCKDLNNQLKKEH